MKKIITAALITLSLSSAALAQTMSDGDIDGDGLLNTEEDKNGDGIVNNGETDPLNADTDRGGEADGAEVQAGRNPLDKTDDITYDLDNDGLTNGQEWQIGTSITKPDTDGDGIIDGKDPFPLDPAYKSDSDKDSIPDEYENAKSLNPEKRSDAEEDRDGDGLNNKNEFLYGTDMDNKDTDGDGVEDGKEVELESDPMENPCFFHAGPSGVLHDLENHWSMSYVTALQEIKIGDGGQRIVRGYETPDGDVFLPDREISRFEFLKIALMGSCIIPQEYSGSGTFSFKDLGSNPRPREREGTQLRRQVVYTAFERGIVEGYGDSTFRSDNPVNRAEALKILFNASRLEPFDKEDYSGRFSDVDDNAWYAPYIENALSYEFIEGYEDGTFRPENPISRAEAAKIVLFMMISNPHVNGYVVPVEGLDI